MKPSDFQKTTQCQFESLLKKVTRGIVTNYRKELSRRQNKEVSFCELPEIVVENFAVWDDYETDYTVFNVCGIDIRVLDDKLAEALKRLPEKKRNILLMFYFLEMSDTEIGDLLNITRRSSHRNRTSSLDEIKKIFKEEK
ncbi:RNA polymerase sigma factor [Hespellia stercorisuis]|uniref:RNA polymerase sigma factor, sigma-70 family n=1 Tax=Hespellia stercorisuis DSM 15480 TaxID=1121950 RepID=A0A1M6VAI5_9FIRM|nr:sigma factor-like helix-turn-helix DNA-binding protein [Hespellia stercorisuis]SHK78502.1 RNA polymerase sigma factor, sigma-70 family [Hespellia stercorisuis DSM 15480]